MNSTLDAASPNAFVAAVQWLNGTLTGALATAVAIIAVASLGMLLLVGHLDTRRAGRIIFGCFIIFGASTIASGILDAVQGTEADTDFALSTPPPPPQLPPSPAPHASSNPYDPYAGAALPPR